jgi:hypothetical protein
VLPCRGFHRSERHRKPWPRRGILRLLAPFRQVAGYIFKERGRLQGRCVSGSKPKLFIRITQPTHVIS